VAKGTEWKLKINMREPGERQIKWVGSTDSTFNPSPLLAEMVADSIQTGERKDAPNLHEGQMSIDAL
jgi:hypothetical protein